MLKVITLYTINSIFSEATGKLSPTAKMLYINCLMHYFKDKEATKKNACAFDMFHSDIPNYEKYRRLFEELHKSDLITVENNSIRFNNYWAKYIDNSVLDRIIAPPDSLDYSQRNLSKIKTAILNNTSRMEIIQMKHPVTMKEIERYLDIFLKTQQVDKKTFVSITDSEKHFTYWLPNNLNKSQKEKVELVSKTSANIFGKRKN